MTIRRAQISMSDSIEQAAIPRQAVAGIVRSADGRILLAQRNPRLKFMGGRYAFPGGAIDADDHAGREPGAECLAAVGAMALARELFKETGLLFAQGELPPPNECREARQSLLGGELPFQEFLGQYELRIDVQRFKPVGVFVTPETNPRRFHARYYLIDQVAVGEEELILGEIVALEWMLPGEARSRWQNKQLDLAPPVAFVLKQFAAFPVDAALERLGVAEPFTASHASCYEIRPGFHVMPLRTPTLLPARHTNCVLVGEARLFVVDPGPTVAEEQQRLTEQIEYLMRDGTQPAAVLLTHGNADHIGSAALLRDRYHVPIWAHKATAGHVGFPVDRLLRDDETISIPGAPARRLRCLHTPGHDPGHLCFLNESSATLISGDMVAGKSSIVIAHGHGGDMSAYLDSLERLLRIDCDLMIPSHGFGFNRPKQTIQKQIDHRLARERKIQAALDAGISGMEQLLAASYDDLPSDMWKYAAYTLKAHLARLGVTDFDE
jgi:glyoxylase-like metal-dependent hydrolase (beta-lactamase superfamily II)/8-oxo-dGTP pyrophosphatase MutT (NUDIX family)